MLDDGTPRRPARLAQRRRRGLHQPEQRADRGRHPAGYIQDSLNARLMGVAPTGNGRRESYAHLPLPRMTNTYMLAATRTRRRSSPASRRASMRPTSAAARSTSPAASSSSAEPGLVGRERQDPVPGQGRDHRRQRPRVAQEGHDDRQRPGARQRGGTCGKDGQSVPVGVASPRCASTGLTVGGTA